MQVNSINSTQTNFKSKFVPNKIMEKSLDRAYHNGDRQFAQSLKAILNDGKDDILELNKRNNRHLSLYVNGKLQEEGNIFLNLYSDVGTELINKYAKKMKDTPVVTDKYRDLSVDEKKLVQENIDIIKLLTENFENGVNFVENVEKELSNIKKKLDSNTKKELIALKDLIFNNK